MLGDQVYFNRTDARRGTELGRLWMTDGTQEGTEELISSRPFRLESIDLADDRFVATNGASLLRYELGEDGQLMVDSVDFPSINGVAEVMELQDATVWRSGNEVWAYDGLTSRNIVPESEVNSGSNPRPMASTNGITLVVANDPAQRPNLFRVDSEGQSALLARSMATATTVGDFFYFFAARNGQRGLWKMEATETAPRFLRAFDSVSNLVVGEDDVVYFEARHEGSTGIWQSDGTEAGTVITPIPTTADMQLDRPIVTANGSVYAIAIGEDRGVWKSDGTPDGTQLLTSTSRIDSVIAIDDFVYARRARELFRIEESARELVSLSIGQSTPRHSAAFPDGTILFIEAGALYRSDAVAPSPRPIFDLSNLNVREFAATGERVFFLASRRGQKGRELWTSDGTMEGTVPLRQFDPSASELGATSSYAVFRVDGVMWKTDGTVEGTTTVPGVPGGSFLEQNDQLTFIRDSDVVITDLRRSSSRRVVIPNPDPETALLTADQLFVSAQNQRGRELWRVALDEVIGDLDNNGSVDATDFLILSRHFGSSDATEREGDIDQSGTVDVRDFLLLSMNFSSSSSPMR